MIRRDDLNQLSSCRFQLERAKRLGVHSSPLTFVTFAWSLPVPDDLGGNNRRNIRMDRLSVLF